MPSIAEVILLPYLVMKKYVSKSNPQPVLSVARDPETRNSETRDRETIELPVSKTR
jgi:hypothetical protein